MSPLRAQMLWQTLLRSSGVSWCRSPGRGSASFSPAGLLRLRRGLRHLLPTAEQRFTLLIRPVFAGGAGYLLVLNNVDFLFRWLVAGAPIYLYVRTDETFTLAHVPPRKPDDYHRRTVPKDASEGGDQVARRLCWLGRERHGQTLFPVLRHPPTLMLATLAAHAATNIRRSSPMLDVVPTSSRQCSLQRYRPILISLGEAPPAV